MSLPSPLVPVAELAMQHAQQAGYLERWPRTIIEQFTFIAGLSKFIVEALQRDEQLAQQLPEMLAHPSRKEHYRTQLAERLAECTDESSGHRILRQFRNREMVYIAWQDFTHAWSLEESLSHLSELAEAIILKPTNGNISCVVRSGVLR